MPAGLLYNAPSSETPGRPFRRCSPRISLLRVPKLRPLLLAGGRGFSTSILLPPGSSLPSWFAANPDSRHSIVNLPVLTPEEIGAKRHKVVGRIISLLAAPSCCATGLPGCTVKSPALAPRRLRPAQLPNIHRPNLLGLIVSQRLGNGRSSGSPQAPSPCMPLALGFHLHVPWFIPVLDP